MDNSNDLSLLNFPGLYDILYFLIQEDTEIFVVGGTIRDIILNRPVLDLDLVTNEAVKTLVRKIKNKFHHPSFPLHKQRNIYRIVPKQGWSIDIAPMQGKSIDEDLKQRDFTINAMALPVYSSKKIEDYKNFLIDPTGGFQDIKKRTIRIVSENAFEADPLRLLRAYRFASTLNFSIEHHTEQLINNNHKKILNVAQERINHELTMLLGLQKVSIPNSMFSSLLLNTIFSKLGLQIDKERLQKTLQKITMFNSIKTFFQNHYSNEAKWLLNHLQSKLSGEFSYQALFLIYLFLPTNSSKQKLTEFGRKMKLSTNCIATIKHWQIAFVNIQKIQLSDYFSSESLLRELFFYHDIYTILAFLKVELENTTNSLSETIEHLHFLIQKFNTKYPNKEKLLKQINGQTIMSLTGLKQGKQLGELINLLQKKIYIGEIENKEQIQEYLLMQNQ